jgi:hypothetical protein
MAFSRCSDEAVRRIGDWHGQPVGCFLVLRNDALPPIPVMTLHRVTREMAIGMVRSIMHAAVVNGYLLAGLNSECDCQGKAELETPFWVRPK